MRILVGLGNPGAQYTFTRHNAGFMMVDFIKERKGCSPWKGERLFVYSLCDTFALVKPLTFMNLSGQAFPHIMKTLNSSLEDIIVAHDDVWIPLGRIRIRKNGSDGGHNGVKSIIDELGRKDFSRIRIGIGPKPSDVPLFKYVLDEFSDDELRVLYKVLNMSLEAFEVIIEDGIDKAMSMFNSKEVE